MRAASELDLDHLPSDVLRRSETLGRARRQGFWARGQDGERRTVARFREASFFSPAVRAALSQVRAAHRVCARSCSLVDALPRFADRRLSRSR